MRGAPPERRLRRETQGKEKPPPCSTRKTSTCSAMGALRAIAAALASAWGCAVWCVLCGVWCALGVQLAVHCGSGFCVCPHKHNVEHGEWSGCGGDADDADRRGRRAGARGRRAEEAQASGEEGRTRAWQTQAAERRRVREAVPFWGGLR